ncbi:hypothetical protein TWF106_011715 [Orbilia oligospora]|uniref:DUF7770 domain-containing protein n=1 Tax=Orbilia oligospora TaxID=2813651 RepID=A0A7C8UN83_ORBOL|nr:hypothetical protein TWF106_011715 [Orbilia oligospora]
MSSSRQTSNRFDETPASLHTVKLVARAPQTINSYAPTNHFLLHFSGPSGNIGSLDVNPGEIEGNPLEGLVTLYSLLNPLEEGNTEGRGGSGSSDDDDDYKKTIVKERDYGVLRQGLTIKRIVDILVENRRDRYDFNGNGEGCTYWCKKVLKDLTREGFLEQDVPENAMDFMSHCWSDKRPEKVPRTPQRGTFHSRP